MESFAKIAKFFSKKFNKRVDRNVAHRSYGRRGEEFLRGFQLLRI